MKRIACAISALAAAYRPRNVVKGQFAFPFTQFVQPVRWSLYPFVPRHNGQVVQKRGPEVRCKDFHSSCSFGVTDCPMHEVPPTLRASVVSVCATVACPPGERIPGPGSRETRSVETKLAENQRAAMVAVVGVTVIAASVRRCGPGGAHVAAGFAGRTRRLQARAIPRRGPHTGRPEISPSTSCAILVVERGAGRALQRPPPPSFRVSCP
jgi:hypothetical protein